jgi:hypothetical protein
VKVSGIRFSLISISKVPLRMRGGGVDSFAIFVYDYRLQPGDVATPNSSTLRPIPGTREILYLRRELERDVMAENEGQQKR